MGLSLSGPIRHWPKAFACGRGRLPPDSFIAPDKSNTRLFIAHAAFEYTECRRVLSISKFVYATKILMKFFPELLLSKLVKKWLARLIRICLFTVQMSMI